MVKARIYMYISPSLKCYIGQTTNHYKRKNVFNDLRRKYGGSKIYNARKKYLPENFIYEVLYECIFDDKKSAIPILNELEIYYIELYDSFNNGYNCNSGGLNFEITDETRLKMSKCKLGKKFSDKHKLSLSISQKGRVITPETRLKISNSQIGIPKENIIGIKNGHSVQLIKRDNITNKILGVYDTVTAASKSINNVPSSIGNCIAGRTKTAGGFV